MERRTGGDGGDNGSPLGFRPSLTSLWMGSSIYSSVPSGYSYSQAATDPQRQFGSDHQTLEADFSLLNISPGGGYPKPEPFLPANLEVADPVIYHAADQDSVYLSTPERTQTDLRRSELPWGSVYGQIGLGGAHRNPTTANVESWGSYPTSPNPTSVDQPRYGDDYYSNYYEYYLHRKKESPLQFHTRYPINPYSNRENSTIDTTRNSRHFNPNGSLFDPSYMSRHNSYHRHLQQLALDFESLSLKDFRGKIVSMAKDQYCCRLLQKKFVNPNAEDINIVLSEVIHHIDYLMEDQFGNHLIQKLVEVCNEFQRTLILHSLAKTQFQLVSICFSLHGTRSIQKLVENLTSEYQISFVLSYITPATVELAQDQNGHHVIQHCLKYFSNEENKHLIYEIADNMFKIATNKSGCCVLQSCVDHSNGEFRARLVSVILENALQLAGDKYGNYVVQHILGLGISEVTKKLSKQLEGNYVEMSRDKFASNVVEKCLKESREEQTSQIIKELLRSREAHMLLVHPYGNFVIQSALSESKGNTRKDLVELVQSNASSIRSNIYGKKVLSHLAKMRVQ